MKPIINGRHGAPLIIFPGKVTQSSTLWNAANCIVCSQRGAGSCGAPPSSRGGSCAIAQQLEPPAGEKSSCERGTHCQSLLATNIAHKYRLWLLAYPPPFRYGQPAQQSGQKIRWMHQAIWVSEESGWMRLFWNCFVFLWLLFVCFLRKEREREFWLGKSKLTA